jgi:alanine dehydrogenase
MLRAGRCCSRICTWPPTASRPALIASGATAIAYETVTAPMALPLLTPMSEVAGRMSVQVGANCLQKANGGFGVLLGGVPGVPRPRS